MNAPTRQPFVQAAVRQLEDTLRAACRDAADHLHREAHQGSDSRARLAAQTLERLHPAIAEAACKLLHNGMAGPPPAPPVPPKAAASGGELSFEIMDDEAATEQVEIARLSELLRDGTALAVAALERVQKNLAGVSPESSQPLMATPAAVARALWQGSSALRLGLPERTRALKAIGTALAPGLQHYYDGLVSALAGRTAMPADPLAPAGGQGPRPASASMPILALDPLHGPEPTTVPSAPGAAARPSELATFDLQQPGALRQLLPQPSQAMAETQPMPDEGDDSRIPKLIHQHRGELSSLPDRESDWAVLELISRLYGQVLADPSLPEAVKPLLGSLEPPVALLARKDASLLDSHRHPAWVLTNKIASQAMALHETDPRQMPEFIATLGAIRSALGNQPEAADFELAVERLQKWRKLLLTRKLTELSPTVEFLRERAHTRPESQAVRDRLQQQMDSAGTSRVARAFVLDVWAAVCEGAVQGPDGFSADEVESLTQELLWSVDPARHREERAALLSRVPRMVAGLRLGMEQIGIGATQQEAWLARLAQVHAQALQREAPRASGRSSAKASASASAPEPITAEQLDELQAGDAIRMQMQGEWVVVQLMWISGNGHFMLFSSPMAGRSHSFTRRALQRMAEAGLLRRLESYSALERATERLSTDFGSLDTVTA